MVLSIQDYLKKINSMCTFTDILSLFVTALGLALFLGYIVQVQKGTAREVVYQENTSSNFGVMNLQSEDGRPFGSSKGATYTFSWCSGSGNIKQANKIYFVSAEDAENRGRTLSKLCKK